MNSNVSRRQIQGWTRARENTSSGPSGLHFGPFIANCSDRGLATLDAAMASIPATTGYTPERWTHGLNVLIPKKSNDSRVTKMRTILLYEADFNQNSKLLGKKMMAAAEAND